MMRWVAKRLQCLIDTICWWLGYYRYTVFVPLRNCDACVTAIRPDMLEWLDENLSGRMKVLECPYISFRSVADLVFFTLAWSEELKPEAPDGVEALTTLLIKEWPISRRDELPRFHLTQC